MEELEASGHRLIGEILFEKQYLTAAQINNVLNLLGISDNLMSRIQQLKNKADITGVDEDAVNAPENGTELI
jgi:hypothetical protein